MVSGMGRRASEARMWGTLEPMLPEFPDAMGDSGSMNLTPELVSLSYLHICSHL